MKPAPFSYYRTRSVPETVARLAELGDGAKILAGGQSLVPMMNFRLARPAALVDVTRIPGLEYLRAGPDGLRIGALTRHRTVELCRDPAVLDGFGVLPRSARWIGHYPIRARGTFGGSIAHADPAAEWCLLAVLLGANVVLSGPSGMRTVPASEFFEGFYTTTAEPDEMLTELHFPRPARRAALTEFSQRQGDFAVVAAAVSVDLGEPGAARRATRSASSSAAWARCRSWWTPRIWPASPRRPPPGVPPARWPRPRSTRPRTGTAAPGTANSWPPRWWNGPSRKRRAAP